MPFMNFMDYFKSFGMDGIHGQLAKLRMRNEITSRYYQTVKDRLVNGDMLDYASQEITSKLTYRQLHYIFIYEMVRLDRHKIYLKPGVRNMALNSSELLDELRSFDFRMRSAECSASYEGMRSIVSLVVIASILEARRLKKKVEMGTMLRLDANLDPKVLMKSLETAQDMLNENIRLADDTAAREELFGWINPKSQMAPSINKGKAY